MQDLLLQDKRCDVLLVFFMTLELILDFCDFYKSHYIVQCYAEAQNYV